MSEGWIKLHRSFLDWEWYDCPNTCRLFIFCMLRANHKDTKWRGIPIKRGQFITSYDKLSIGTGLSVRNVRTSLKNLESTGEVTRESTNHMTMLTVCNYSTYNDIELSTDKPNDKQVTHDRQATDKQPTTDKNEKNLKNEEDIKEVLDYLNAKTGKNFRTAKGLKSRFDDGYTVEDAKKVIDVKFAEWIKDPKMVQFIRPETLFSGKFDSYLNEDTEALLPKVSYQDKIQNHSVH